MYKEILPYCIQTYSNSYIVSCEFEVLEWVLVGLTPSPQFEANGENL